MKMRVEKTLLARLALQQLLNNRKRSRYILFSVALTAVMFVALGGVGVSAMNTFGPIVDSFILIMGIMIYYVAVGVIIGGFLVSTKERARQFSIMKSIGASDAQLRQTVTFEGFFLAIAGIPLGILPGIGLQFVMTHVINRAMADSPFHLGFSIHIGAIALTLFAAFFIILLGAYIPAQIACDTPPIEAIRGYHPEKPKKKKGFRGFIAGQMERFFAWASIPGRLFGFEGELASKQLKHNRGHFRATILAICISVSLVLAAFSINLNTAASMQAARTIEQGSDLQIHLGTVLLDRTDFDRETFEAVTRALGEFPDTEISTYRMSLPLSRRWQGGRIYHHTPSYLLHLISVDPEQYAELIEQAGVPYGSNLLINTALQMDRRGNITPYHPHRPRWGGEWAGHEIWALRFIAGPTYNIYAGGYFVLPTVTQGAHLQFPVHAELRYLEDYTLIDLASWGALPILTLIVPDLDPATFLWDVRTADPMGFAIHAQQVFEEYAVLQPWERYWIHDHYQSMVFTLARMEFMEAMTLVFTAVIILVGLIHLIGTISASVQLRAKEFAILSSIGMEKQGLRRMLNLESLIASTRAVLYGLPLGVLLAARVIYPQMLPLQPAVRMPFLIPWAPMLPTAVVIFVVTFVVMQFCVGVLRKLNVIETIRGLD